MVKQSAEFIRYLRRRPLTSTRSGAERATALTPDKAARYQRLVCRCRDAAVATGWRCRQHDQDIIAVRRTLALVNWPYDTGLSPLPDAGCGSVVTGRIEWRTRSPATSVPAHLTAITSLGKTGIIKYENTAPRQQAHAAGQVSRKFAQWKRMRQIGVLSGSEPTAFLMTSVRFFDSTQAPVDDCGSTGAIGARQCRGPSSAAVNFAPVWGLDGRKSQRRQ